jgi:hypothetical protein
MGFWSFWNQTLVSSGGRLRTAVLAGRGDRLARAATTCDPVALQFWPIANRPQVRDIRRMEPQLEQMARSLVESGDYRVTSRLEPKAEYHQADDSPKLVAAVVDVETTGINPDRDKIVELGICLFEYDRQSGRIYRVLGSWEWLEDPVFRSRLRSRRSPALPIHWSLVTALVIALSTIC